ncbi:MAG TPA: arylamine N-acetyltransferase, partial [Kofleriaceae bacterium]
DAYFERIGWQGSRAATHDVLAGLVDHHVRAIPFENLDVLLGDKPRLDLGSLERKLIDSRRGGYCYEHATLFAAVLTELGFAVKTHSARVVMVTPRTAAPRTHMFLTVGDFVLDPGFGASAPRVPVPLDGTPAGAHRIGREGDEIVLELDGQRLWMSSLEHDIPIDFEMANHFTATHPSSHFTQSIMMRVYTADGQLRIRNRDVTLMRGNETQTFQLADRAELRALVAKQFGFDLPAIETIHVPAIADWR